MKCEKLVQWLQGDGGDIYCINWALYGDITFADVLAAATDAVGEQVSRRDLTVAAKRAFKS